MQKTIAVNGAEYTLGTIKMGVGRRLKAKYPDPEDYNVAFVGESLKAGGNPDASYEWVDENLDYGNSFIEFVSAAFEVNGFKLEKPKTGEDQPPVAAAE
jgi:hypothetical protein